MYLKDVNLFFEVHDRYRKCCFCFHSYSEVVL
uniref:Uncharacterized protein n=1 Tax=Arundo donax TaxID=35708 RepID=A0A0A9D673_ARUDO